MTHALKTWPEFFHQVERGVKTFEIRKYDRPFCMGETLLLQEWEPEKKEYTGKEIKREITYILHGGQFGIEKDFCVMGIKEIEEF
jgi:hypothetical protein